MSDKGNGEETREEPRRIHAKGCRRREREKEWKTKSDRGVSERERDQGSRENREKGGEMGREQRERDRKQRE